MSAKRKTTVGVIFGGRSVEHDVSVVTGHQIMNAFDPERYRSRPDLHRPRRQMVHGRTAA